MYILLHYVPGLLRTTPMVWAWDLALCSISYLPFRTPGIQRLHLALRSSRNLLVLRHCWVVNCALIHLYLSWAVSIFLSSHNLAFFYRFPISLVAYLPMYHIVSHRVVQYHLVSLCSWMGVGWCEPPLLLGRRGRFLLYILVYLTSSCVTFFLEPDYIIYTISFYPI